MNYTFNELSIKKFDNVYDAKNVLEKFILTTVKAKEIGFEVLRINETVGNNLYNLELTDNYLICNWLADENVDNVLKEKFRNLFTISPLISYNDLDELNLYKNSEFKLNFNSENLNVFGLGAAYLLDTLAISFLSDDFWNKNEIGLLHYYLDNDCNEKIENIVVKHISNTENVYIHKNWLEQNLLNSLENSKMLWFKRLEFFPDLILCGIIEEQLTKIGFSKYFNQIIEKLKELNKFAKNWKDGDFNYNFVNQNFSLNISPESKQTVQKYGNQRKFKLPSGKKELFELHIKTDDLRFHFYPDNLTHTIYVGYIGKHLDTFSG